MVAVRPTRIGGANRASSAAASTAPNVVNSGRALQTAARATQAIGDELFRNTLRKDNLNATKAEARFDRRVQERLAELDPTASDYDQEVQEVLQEERQGTLEDAQIETQRAYDELSTNLSVRSEGERAIATDQRRVALEDEALDTLSEAQNQALAKIRNDPDGADAYIAEFQTRANRLKEAISPEQHDDIDRAAAVSATVARVEGLAQEARYEEARKLAEEQAGSMDPETFRSTKRRIREIQNQARQDFLSDTAAQVTNLEIGIVDASSEAGLSGIRQRIESLNQEGFFQGRQHKRAALIKQIEAKRGRLRTGQEELGVALAKFDSGTGNDTQKEADLVWGVYSDKLPEDASAADRIDHAVNFASKSGYLPTEFKRLVENAERVTNQPDLLATAAQVYDRASADDAQIDMGLRNRENSRVRLTATYQDVMGTSYEDAANLVNENIPDAAKLKERREVFDEEVDDLDFNNLIGDALDQGGFLGIGDLDAEDVSARARAEYERALRVNYEMSGDMEIATAAASRRFRERYGTTRVGDVEQVTMHPPERFFPGAINSLLTPDQKATIITQDVEQSLQELGVTPGIVVGQEGVGTERPGLGQQLPSPSQEGEQKLFAVDESGVPAYRLVADDRTERALARGEPPSYEVRVRNDFGVLVPLRVDTDAGSQIVRWDMPSRTEIENSETYRGIVEEETGAVNRQRERRIQEQTQTDNARKALGDIIERNKSVGDQKTLNELRSGSTPPAPGRKPEAPEPGLRSMRMERKNSMTRLERIIPLATDTELRTLLKEGTGEVKSIAQTVARDRGMEIK
jgi:hypothetical protein